MPQWPHYVMWQWTAGTRKCSGDQAFPCALGSQSMTETEKKWRVMHRETAPLRKGCSHRCVVGIVQSRWGRRTLGEYGDPLE